MTGLREFVNKARKLTPGLGVAAFALALLALIPGCPPTALIVRVACPDEDEVTIGTVVEITATANRSGTTIAITADSGATVVDNGDGTATVTSATPGTVTVTATGTNGTRTDTDTCTITFVGAVIPPPAEGTDVAPGQTVTLTADISSLGGGAGGEGDDFTFSWSVTPAEAGTFDCGENDQDPSDQLTTDCQSISFTVAADFSGSFTVSVTVTRNSDGAEFTANLDFTSTAPPECTTDADCSNSAFCDGVETCVEGVCQAGTAPCGAGETCDEDTDTCVPPGCTSDADCDDGVFCNGEETCDVATGDCVAGTAPCGADEICDEDADTCEPECTVDADCDDGVFCNGSETCVGGACQAGTSPCNADETCDEDTDACIPPSGTTFRLTTGVDIFSGSSGDDVFDATRDFSGGAENVTLGNSDSLDGNDGTDRLIVQSKTGTALNVTPSALTDIEVIEVEIVDANAGTLSLANSNAVTTLKSNSSAGALTFANGQTVVENFAMTNTSQNMTVTISKTNALAGSSDEGTLTLSSVTGGTFTAQPAAAGSGYDTFNVVSSGGAVNTLTTFSQGNGTSLTTMNFSGDQNLTITNALPNTVTTVDASSMTGNLSIVLPATNITVTGGSGNDTINAAGSYSTSDTLNGGSGTGDKLVLNSAEAAVAGNQSNVSGFENLQIANALANDLVISRFGCTQITLVGGGTGTLTIPVGGTLEVSTNNSGALTVSTPAGSDTTSDTLNVNVKGVNVAGNFTATSWEALNIAVSNGAVQFTGNITLNNIAGNQKITVTGNTALTLGDNIAADTLTADELDASDLTAALTMTIRPQIAIVIKGGSGNDTLAGSTSGDDVQGGNGNDRLIGFDGGDVLTGGSGNDTFVFGSRTQTGDVIADMDAGTSSTAVDKIAFVLDDSGETNAWDDDTLTNAIAQCQGAAADPIAAVVGAPTVQRITADATVANNGVSIFIMDDGVDYTAATLQTALQAAGNRTITTGSDGTVVAVNFLVVYDKGSSIAIGVIRNAANATTTEGCTVTEIITISNVSSLTNIDATDFVYE